MDEWMNGQRERQTDRQTDRQTETNRQKNDKQVGQPDRQTDRHAETQQSDRHAVRQTCRDSNQTDMHRGGVRLMEGGDVQGRVEALVGKCSDKGPP